MSARTTRLARIGDEQVRRHARVETRIRAGAGMDGRYGSVTASVRKQSQCDTSVDVAVVTCFEPTGVIRRRAEAAAFRDADGRGNRSAARLLQAVTSMPERGKLDSVV